LLGDDVSTWKNDIVTPVAFANRCGTAWRGDYAPEVREAE
jgi:hypothetical protein